MGQTQYYSLAFFDFGDQLDTRINVQKEIDRFVVIDKQLYGIYKVFQNGVIDGWIVRDNGYSSENGISVSVSEGSGIVNFLAAQSDLPGYVNNLTPNTVVDIYVTVVGNTEANRTIRFFASGVPVDSEASVRVARVGTGSSGVNYIDNTIRKAVGFDDIIQQTIDDHKHRGTPSKINLETETKNQLSGARIGDVDASKITSGVFEADRIPIIDHNSLKNNGLLSHAALDSFVQTFSQNNKELLGEITTINTLKLIIFNKYLDATVDEHFVNELIIIPGISPNSFIDFTNSTAHINLDDHCISGYPAQTGIFTSVYWNSTYSFNTYHAQSNMVIEDDTVSLDRSSFSEYKIADFSDGLEGFEASTSFTDSSSRLDAVVVDGNKRARMGGGSVSVVYYYKKTFSSPQNWDGVYDELSIKVKTSEQIHSPVYMYILNGESVSDVNAIIKPTNAWKLLDKDEHMSSLTEKTFNISSLGINSAVQIVIYTTDDFEFDVDDIFVRRTNMVASSGVIRFRYESQSNITFHSMFYTSIAPDDSRISVRIKVAPSIDLLSRAAYSLPMSSGDVFSLSGSAAEIEVSMTSNLEQTLSPILSSIELRLLTEANFTGFSISTASDFNRGTFSNSELDTSLTDKVIIKSPINVGGRYFSKNSSVSEVNDSNVGVLGFSGNKMPISPDQAYSWSISSSRSFNTVSSIYRLQSKNYLIADLKNNRIMEVDENGNLVRGIGSSYVTSSKLSPLTAIYNPLTQVLSVAFTKVPTVLDKTKISFYLGGSTISLTSDDIVLANNKSGKKILEIGVDDDTAVRLTGASSENLSVKFGAGAFTESININEGMNVSGNSIYSGVAGLTCFVGNFTFVDNIRHPVFAGLTNEGNWIVANSSIMYGEDSASKDKTIVPDLIEFNPENPDSISNKLSITTVKFSDFSLGSVYEFETDRFLVACINQSSSPLGGINGDDLRSVYNNSVPESVEFRASALDALGEYRGQIMLVDKVSNRSTVFYTSPDGLYPSDIDVFSDGDYLVAESCFGTSSGRLIALDVYGNINWNYGSGTFHIINDAKVVNDDNIIVSV